jgi:hypothetical protein
MSSVRFEPAIPASERHIVGRTPLDDGSARHIDLYMTKHKTYKRHPCPRWDSNLQSQQASGHGDQNWHIYSRYMPSWGGQQMCPYFLPSNPIRLSANGERAALTCSAAPPTEQDRPIRLLYPRVYGTSNFGRAALRTKRQTKNTPHFLYLRFI